MCICECQHRCALVHMGRSEDNGGDQFSPSTLSSEDRAQVILLVPAANTFTHRALSLAHFLKLIFVPAQIGGKNIQAFHTQTLFLSLHEIVTDLLKYICYISLLFPVFPFHHVSWELMICKAACVQIPEDRAASRCHSCLPEVVSLNGLMRKSPH